MACVRPESVAEKARIIVRFSYNPVQKEQEDNPVLENALQRIVREMWQWSCRWLLDSEAFQHIFVMFDYDWYRSSRSPLAYEVLNHIFQYVMQSYCLKLQRRCLRQNQTPTQMTGWKIKSYKISHCKTGLYFVCFCSYLFSVSVSCHACEVDP